MRLIEISNAIYESIIAWKLALWVLPINTLLLSALLVPSLLTSGLISTIHLIKSSSFLCFLIFLSVSFWCFYTTQFIIYIFLDSLNSAERKRIMHYLLHDSMLLQFLVISLGDSKNNSIEVLIWAFTFVYYSSCKILSIIAKSRLQNNHVRNLQELILTTIGVTTGFIIFTAYMFSSANLSLVLLINYDGLLVLKESLATWYQLKHNFALSRRHDLMLNSAEILINIWRWIHLAIWYSEWFLSSSLQVLVIMRQQKYIANLIRMFKRYSNYKVSMRNFIKKYPPLSEAELSKHGDEKCCICWEPLTHSKCSRISCGHIHHVDCIRTWVLNNTEKKCPLCNQVFLQPEIVRERSWWNFSFSRNAAGVREQREREVEQVREILPHIPHEVIRRELERTGSMDETIANMLDE